MTPLYDLYRTEMGYQTFVMRAPAEVVGQFCNFAYQAVDRFVRECDKGERECVLHDERGGKVWLVKQPITNLYAVVPGTTKDGLLQRQGNGTYTCVINEEQRAILHRALEVFIALSSPGDENAGERTTLYSMLGDLPKDEAENPGIVHGLCL